MPRLKLDQLLFRLSTGVAANSLPMYIKSTWAQYRQLGQGLASDNLTWRPQGISVTIWTHFFHNPLVWLLVDGKISFEYVTKITEDGFQESSQNPINVVVEETEEQWTFWLTFCHDKMSRKKTHWKSSQGTFLGKWAECIQNAEDTHPEKEWRWIHT